MTGLPPATVERLAALAGGRVRSVGEDELERWFGEAAGWLIASGVLAIDQSDTSVICTDCGELHPVEVEFSPLREAWGFVCPDQGWRPRDPVERRTWRIDAQALAEAVADGIGATTEARHFQPDDTPAGGFRLDCLGVVQGSANWTAFLCLGPGDNDALELLTARLRGPVGKEAGLVLCTGRPPKAYPLPNRHRIAWIEECLELHPSGLRAAPGIERLMSGKRPKKASGAPTLKAEGIKLLKSRSRHKIALEDHEAEVARIRNILQERYPGEKIPKIRQMRFEWFKDMLGSVRK